MEDDSKRKDFQSKDEISRRKKGLLMLYFAVLLDLTAVSMIDYFIYI